LLNNRTRVTIKTPYGKTEEYNVGELVRQGSALGATISANSLGTVQTDAENGMAGAKMGNIHIHPLCFQDDIAAVGNTKAEARRNQSAVEVFQDRKRLQLHPEKSQCLRIKKEKKDMDKEELLLLNGKQMKTTSSYKYLGEYLSEKGTEAITVEKRCKEIQGVMNEILAVAKSDELKHRRIEIGARLASACLDTKLLYNAETWINLTKSDVKKLEVIQMSFYKRLMGLPGGTPNAAVRKELGVLPMEYKIETMKLMEYQRILQMGEDRLPKKVSVYAKEMGTKNILDEADEIKRRHCLEYDDDSISQMTKNQWRNKVKKSVSTTAQKKSTTRMFKIEEIESCKDR